MVNISKITWLSEIAKEAELIVTDGSYECVAFSHPCVFEEGALLTKPLYVFMAENIMIAEEKKYFIQQREKGKLAHNFVAEVIDVEEGVVRIGEITFIIEESFPSDIKQGDYVIFSCERIDVY